MSHVADCDFVVKDLNSVEAAIKPFGGILHRGQTTHEWYGEFLNDWSSDRAAAKRRDPKTFGKCTHAISFPGIKYEIGLVQEKDGTFTPVYDSFGGSKGLHDGQCLEQLLGGAGLPLLKDEYAAAVTTRLLGRQGFRLTRTVDKATGEIVLKATN